ncbi:MAG: flagellar export protein FliJ [Oscillospiraceae bacterium]|nr:flagellar export protein FliJ [Oscillospiraceae bacterium]
MKKFAFSLQKLLDYKEQIFDIERSVLADMRAVLARLEQELTEMKDDQAARAGELRQKMMKGIPAIEMETHKNYLTMLDFSIKQKIQQIEMQKTVIEKQAEKVREAKIDISTMEKLKERKLEEYNHAVSKAEEIFIEEFVNNANLAKEAI